MDRKQKERLRTLLKARKRADKVLARRRETAQAKEVHQQRLDARQELKRRYSEELTGLAQESCILPMAEQAALRCGGTLAQEVSYYIDYGLSSSSLRNPSGAAGQGTLRAAHLTVTITWEADGAHKEAQIRVHKNGWITFHNSFFPVFPLIWRWDSQLLQKMLASAMKHPKQHP